MMDDTTLVPSHVHRRTDYGAWEVVRAAIRASACGRAHGLCGFWILWRLIHPNPLECVSEVACVYKMYCNYFFCSGTPAALLPPAASHLPSASRTF